jgi:hypothetical protein
VTPEKKEGEVTRTVGMASFLSACDNPADAFPKEDRPEESLSQHHMSEVWTHD